MIIGRAGRTIRLMDQLGQLPGSSGSAPAGLKRPVATSTSLDDGCTPGQRRRCRYRFAGSRVVPLPDTQGPRVADHGYTATSSTVSVNRNQVSHNLSLSCFRDRAPLFIFANMSQMIIFKGAMVSAAEPTHAPGFKGFNMEQLKT